MKLRLPPDPFNRIKVLAVEIATTVIFIYFVVKEVAHVLAQ
jgi:hypothetical protein